MVQCYRYISWKQFTFELDFLFYVRLRTYDTQHPYPEEFNRQSVSCLTDIHLCATELAANNLYAESKGGQIHVVGNTVLDNLRGQVANEQYQVLITLHRRENHEQIDKWFSAIDTLAGNNLHLNWIFSSM